MNKAHASVPGVAELTATLAEIVPQVAAHGSFNFMFSNGVALWAHCSTVRLHASAPAPGSRPRTCRTRT